MDSLHDGGVEIVSPNFMNTRALSVGTVVIPERSRRPVETKPESSPEDLVFDKAEEAESLENLRLAHSKVTEEISVAEDRVEEVPEGTEREKIQREISLLQRRKEHLKKVISGRESQDVKD